MTSSADAFVALIGVCRELGLTGVDDAAVRRPHLRVDEFRHREFSADAGRLGDLARKLTAATADGGTEAALADWTGRSGRAAGGALRIVGGELAALESRLGDGAAALARADAVLTELLARHRGVLRTVSSPRLAGIELEALPAALNSGALSPQALRGDVQARLDYAEAAGDLAGDAIAATVAQVAAAWSAHLGSDGELALADLR